MPQNPLNLLGAFVIIAEFNLFPHLVFFSASLHILLFRIHQSPEKNWRKNICQLTSKKEQILKEKLAQRSKALEVLKNSKNAKKFGIQNHSYLLSEDCLACKLKKRFDKLERNVR